MILTRDEVKNLLNISDTSKDNLIDLNIPIVEEAIRQYCRNDFCVRLFDSIISSAFTFSASSNSINLSNISSYSLKNNDMIVIYGSLSNDGIYTIETVNADSLTIYDLYSIEDEDENNVVTLHKIRFPLDIKLTAAKMVNYNISSFKTGITEEKIDDYSVKFESNIYSYPSGIMSGLINHRKLFKKTPFNYWEV